MLNGRNDVVTHRIIVSCIGATVLLTGLAISILSAMEMEVPPSLPAFGGTALGALTALIMSIFKPDLSQPKEEKDVKTTAKQ